MSRASKKAAVAAVLVALAAGAGVAVFYGFFYIRHFHAVKEGVLYRAGQPDLSDLRRLRDRYGVRTVVDLRRENEQRGQDGPTLAQERAEAERLGLRFVHLPMDADEDVDAGAVRRWLALVRDQSNWPIVVHCKRGVDRTGTLVACYRMEVEGWSPQQALDEAVSHRFEPESNKHIEQFLLGYRSGAGAASSGPATASYPSSSPVR